MSKDVRELVRNLTALGLGHSKAFRADQGKVHLIFPRTDCVLGPDRTLKAYVCC